MNRIDKLFKEKEGKILSIYFTAGYPQLGDTKTIIKALADSGVDLIEIGMPFSDPLADGPVIQQSSQVALQNGMSIRTLFGQLKDIRLQTKIPLILMGYINPVMQYGMDAFVRDAAALGVDGVILPDLPLDVYLESFKATFDRCGLHYISLITPQTSDERIRAIDGNSNGFIYLVSSASTTGARATVQGEQEAYFRRITAMRLRNPTLIGFGISNAETFEKACEHSHGAIIGSAFVKALGGDAPLTDKVKYFVQSIRK